MGYIAMGEELLTELVSFKCSPSERAQLRELARRAEVTDSEIVRQLIRRADDLLSIPPDVQKEWHALASYRREHPARTLAWLLDNSRRDMRRK